MQTVRADCEVDFVLGLITDGNFSFLMLVSAPTIGFQCLHLGLFKVSRKVDQMAETLRHGARFTISSWDRTNILARCCFGPLPVLALKPRTPPHFAIVKLGSYISFMEESLVTIESLP